MENHHLFLGKSTIYMAMFNSKLLVYQGVTSSNNGLVFSPKNPAGNHRFAHFFLWGFLSGWWYTMVYLPLWKTGKSVGILIPSLWKNICSKPPTSCKFPTNPSNPTGHVASVPPVVAPLSAGTRTVAAAAAWAKMWGIPATGGFNANMWEIHLQNLGKCMRNHP